MPRTDLKTRTPIGSAMDNQIFIKMKEHSKKTGIPISKMLDRAMTLYLETNKQF